MKTSETGIKLIKDSEGFSAFIFNDVGKPAIGHGHDLTHDEIISGVFNSGITETAADVLLRKDLAERYESPVNALVPADCSQNQFDALIDFCYNLGPTALKTMLSHGWYQVPQQIPRWNHAGGVELAGLTARRQKEVDLFTS